jgi:hypothetical protein
MLLQGGSSASGCAKALSGRLLHHIPSALWTYAPLNQKRFDKSEGAFCGLVPGHQITINCWNNHNCTYLNWITVYSPAAYDSHKKPLVLWKMQERHRITSWLPNPIQKIVANESARKPSYLGTALGTAYLLCLVALMLVLTPAQVSTCVLFTPCPRAWYVYILWWLREVKKNLVDFLNTTGTKTNIGLQLTLSSPPWILR